MTPYDPQIYHITHVRNLPSILRERGLWCDKQTAERNIAPTNIGHKHIKARRLQHKVTVAAGGTLGDYVPFYFCTRSPMLFRITKRHQDYDGGQHEIVYLVSRVRHAIACGSQWAFTDRHAELEHSQQFDDLKRLDEVRWDFMTRKYWKDIREERQAEFLVHQFFPWHAVVELAAMTKVVQEQVDQLLVDVEHKPLLSVRPNWYY